MARVSFLAKHRALENYFDMDQEGTRKGLRIYDGVLHELAHLVVLGEKAEEAFDFLAKSPYPSLVTLVEDRIAEKSKDANRDEARTIAASILLFRRVRVMQNTEGYIRGCVRAASGLSPNPNALPALVAEELGTEATRKRAETLYQMVETMYDLLTREAAQAA